MGTQKDLLNAVIATGKPFILVVIASKPLVIDESFRTAASAIIWQFCPGMLGGRATARAIFGQINPSGRLTISIPRHVGQLPVYYQRIRGQHQQTYADILESPAYAFGYGLSYSQISYDSAKVDKLNYKIGENITVTIAVTNHGIMDAVEIIQVYVADLVTSATWAEIELKGFVRQFIAAGKTVIANVIIPVEELSIVDRKGNRVVEPGDFEMRVGKASDNILYRLPITVNQ
jgi:beta-glucosidase